MNYPVWERFAAGGGILMVVIAVVHVYVAHFAVGGGLFLVLTEWMGYRSKNTGIVDYVKTHSFFFLLLSMVFGAVTGVGIWFTISLISPGVTSILIHNFVFGWATEWVFFAGEIAALFIYWYRFGKMDKGDHLKIGWFYFLFGWLSLFMVNGIIGFMLTPGKWIETKIFWDGFFNPTMWPSLGFRTFISFMFAGIFGFVTAVFIKADDVREKMINWCAGWTLLSCILSIPFLWWYFQVLPVEQKEMILTLSNELKEITTLWFLTIPMILAGIIFMLLKTRGWVQKSIAFAILILGLMFMGGFEWSREAGRRPYLIYDHTWANAIAVGSEEKVNRNGILKTARWVENREITHENRLEAGKEIFRLQCVACHSVGGPMNDILELTKKYSVFGLDTQIAGQGKITAYMPVFMGTREERYALAGYIVEGLHGRKASHETVPLASLSHEVPAFDAEKDAYVLLAASGFGMRIDPDPDALWRLGNGSSIVYAQLIHRGETPEIVTEDVTLTWAVDAGLSGARVQNRKTKINTFPEKGDMQFSDEKMSFFAEKIPVMSHDASGMFTPYPLVTVAAKDNETGRILAQTRIVVPVSSQMGCGKCHGDQWSLADGDQLNHTAALDVLKIHDRMNRTTLSRYAGMGRQVNCKSCHNTGDDPDQKKILNLSSAVHGFHVLYLKDRESDACMACHGMGENGDLSCFRGVHKAVGLECASCHGNLEDMAISLLKADGQMAASSAKKLMAHLEPSIAESVDKIAPRKPWENLPDCLNCHIDFNEPDTDQAPLDQWTASTEELFRNGTDDAGIMCIMCHGSPHAIYPAENPYDMDRDNIPVMQHQKMPYPFGANKNCQVCHTIQMEDPIHHPNMLAMFRNTR